MKALRFIAQMFFASAIAALLSCGGGGGGGSGTATTGNLALTISGLPSDTNATITVSGPNGFSRTVVMLPLLSST